MSYDEAKLVVFESLVPAQGECFRFSGTDGYDVIVTHVQGETVFVVRRGAQRHLGCATFKQWWRGLNDGKLARSKK